MTLPVGPGPWVTHAACIGRQHDMILPERSRNKDRGTRYAVHVSHAKAICNTCPVKPECRNWALGTPDPAEGFVAGGLTPDDRNRRRDGTAGTPRHLPIAL